MPRGGSIIGRSVTLVPLARPSAPPASPIAVDVLSPTPGLPLTVVPPMVVPPVALLPGGLDTGDSPDPFGASCVLTGLDVTDGGFPAMTGTAERWSTEPPGPRPSENPAAGTLRRLAAGPPPTASCCARLPPARASFRLPAAFGWPIVPVKAGLWPGRPAGSPGRPGP